MVNSAAKAVHNYFQTVQATILTELLFLSNSREKDDLQQQSSEIRQKLQGKVNECLSLEKSRDETTKKLNEAQRLVQQVGV